jgi:hypothetical protein
MASAVQSHLDKQAVSRWRLAKPGSRLSSKQKCVLIVSTKMTFIRYFTTGFEKHAHNKEVK